MQKVIAILLLSGTPALAQTHGGDIELEIAGDQIVTNQRVYAAELGDTGIPNEIDEPGFDSLPGTFPSGSSVGFSILDSLRVWNGTDFDSIPNETMSIRFGSSLGPITTPATPGSVEGFFLNVAGDGSWHRHLDFVLNAPASTGIYLMQLQMQSSDAEITASDPLFIVFNQNDSELNHDAAIEFVQSSLTVPEPGSLILVGIMASVSLWRVRRRTAAN